MGKTPAVFNFGLKSIEILIPLQNRQVSFHSKEEEIGKDFGDS